MRTPRQLRKGHGVCTQAQDNRTSPVGAQALD